MPDLLQILINIQTVLPMFMTTLKVIVAIMSLFIITGSLFELWGLAHDNHNKYMAANRRFSLAGGLMGLLVGGTMLSMTTLDFIGITTRTLTGGSVTSQLLAYSAGGAAAISLSASAQAGTNAIFMILQVVGFLAYIKFFMLLKNRYDGSGANQQGGLGIAFGYLLGGFACWNAQWLGNVVNNDIFGFKLLGLFFN